MVYPLGLGALLRPNKTGVLLGKKKEGNGSQMLQPWSHEYGLIKNSLRPRSGLYFCLFLHF